MNVEDRDQKVPKDQKAGQDACLPYEAPQIIDESTFERLSLNCPFGEACIGNSQLS